MKEEYWIVTDYPQIKTSDLIKEAKEILSNVCIYDESNIDTQFPAPKEMEIGKFRKSIEPDKEHLGKSYDDFIAEKKEWMSLRQYLILALQVFKTTGEHLDVKGWTRTSNLWSDGCLVRGDWYGGTSELRLGLGGQGPRGSVCGPREKINLKDMKTGTLKCKLFGHKFTEKVWKDGSPHIQKTVVMSDEKIWETKLLSFCVRCGKEKLTCNSY